MHPLESASSGGGRRTDSGPRCRLLIRRLPADAKSAALAILKELHLPANPAFMKSLVAIFEDDLGSAEASQGLGQGVSSSEVHPPVGFAPPPPPASSRPSITEPASLSRLTSRAKSSLTSCGRSFTRVRTAYRLCRARLASIEEMTKYPERFVTEASHSGCRNVAAGEVQQPLHSCGSTGDMDYLKNSTREKRVRSTSKTSKITFRSRGPRCAMRLT